VLKLCPVCKREAHIDPSRASQGDRDWIACERCCGPARSLEVGGSWWPTRQSDSEAPFPDLSGVLRHAFERGETLCVLNDVEAQELRKQAPKSADGKAKQLLRAIASKAENRAGKEVVLRYAIDYPLAYASDEKELQLYLDQLGEKRWIEVKHDQSTASCMLTVSGLMEVESTGS